MSHCGHILVSGVGANLKLHGISDSQDANPYVDIGTLIWWLNGWQQLLGLATWRMWCVWVCRCKISGHGGQPTCPCGVFFPPAPAQHLLYHQAGISPSLGSSSLPCTLFTPAAVELQLIVLVFACLRWVYKACLHSLTALVGLQNRYAAVASR